MGVINIGNIKNHANDGSIAIRVDRTSVLGNPFHMRDESQREVVCDQYETYFHKKLMDEDVDFIVELDRIVNLLYEHDITLMCWCYPKRCHAETIKHYIERRYKNDIK